MNEHQFLKQFANSTERGRLVSGTYLKFKEFANEHGITNDDISNEELGELAEGVVERGLSFEDKYDESKWEDESEQEIYIYGASDDLIEIEGDISKDFYTYDDSPTIIEVNPVGMVFSVSYTHDGMWEVRGEAVGDYEHLEPSENPYIEYSEAVRLTGKNLSVKMVDNE